MCVCVCVCVYSSSRNDVARVAQRYGTISTHTRRRASVLVVFVVFCMHMYSFAGLIKRTPPNERGLRLLEFATFNNLVLTNTLGPHKPSRRWTWHSPDGKHHNQIDYILVKKRFRSGVNIHRTRSFPGADIGSDHDLVMMTFQVRLQMARKPNQPRLRFDLEKLRNPEVACTFQATIGGKFAPLIGLSDEDMDMDTMITTYNTAVTDVASEILGKERRRKKPWVTKDVLDLCDERRDLTKKRYEAEGAKEYREANRRVQKAVKKAKEDIYNIAESVFLP